MDEHETTPAITRDQLLSQIADHHLAFLGYSFSILRNWTSAEDIVQETYVTIAEKWESYQQKVSVFYWARRILRNKCYDYLRKKREVLLAPEELPSLLESSLEVFNEEASAQMNEDIKVLGECFKSLKERSKKLLYNFYVNGKSCVDIAQDAGQQKRTPVIQLHRLRRQLRECMQKSKSERKAPLSEETELLMDEFFNENTTEKELEQVHNWLKADSQNAALLAQYAQERSIFAYTIREQIDDSTNNPSIDSDNSLQQFSPLPEEKNISITTQSKTTEHTNATSFSKTTLWFGMAACLTICLGLWYSVINSTHKVQPVGVITAGNAFLAQENGTSTELQTGSEIHFGDTIITPEASSCTIEFINESTSLQIAENSELKLLENIAESKRTVFLEIGEILAQIDRQPRGNALLFETQHTKIAVLGTRFRLETTPFQSSISLIEGRVQMNAINFTQQEIVSAGQKATIRQGTELIELSDNSANNHLASNIFTEDSLIAHFSFDANTSNTILDSSPFKANGILDSGLDPAKLWVPGKMGTGILLPGQGKMPEQRRVVFSNFPQKNIDNRMSISFWIKSSLNAGLANFEKPNVVNIISTINNSDNSGWAIVSRIRAKTETGYSLGFKIPGSKSERERDTTFTDTPFYKWNEWYHFAATFDQGILRIYRNGQQTILSNIVPPLIRTESASNLRLGFQKALEPYDVILDELILFNRALTPQEIYSLHDVHK